MSRIVLAPWPLFFLVACTAQPARDPAVNTEAAEQREPVAVDAHSGDAGGARNSVASNDEASVPPDALQPPAPGTPGGLPDDRTPIAETPFAPDSAQGAANVVQTYYALIGEAKYREAFALRIPGSGAAGSAGPFAADFARYSEYHANIGAPGPVDAGAGQRYVTVPVQIYARLKQSRKPLYQIGTVTLHRTADIDGASPEQRQWRIQSIEVKDAPRR